MAIAKYRSKISISGNGGIIYPPGTELEFNEAEAQSLLAVGAIAPIGKVQPAVDTPPSSETKQLSDPLNLENLEEGDEVIDAIDHLSAEDAIALAELSTDRAELNGYLQSEKAGKNRKTVIQAIERQIASLN